MYSQRGRGGFSGNSSYRGGRPYQGNGHPPRPPAVLSAEFKALLARAINEGQPYDTGF